MLKLVLAAFGVIFALSLLAATLVFVAWSRLKALLTGKKSPPLMAFGRFQRFSTQDLWAAAAARTPGAEARSSGDVLDVEAREVRDERHLR